MYKNEVVTVRGKQKLVPGRNWGIQEEVKKSGHEMCVCGRGPATSSVWDGTMICGVMGKDPACKECSREQKKSLEAEADRLGANHDEYPESWEE